MNEKNDPFAPLEKLYAKINAHEQLDMHDIESYNDRNKNSVISAVGSKDIWKYHAFLKDLKELLEDNLVLMTYDAKLFHLYSCFEDMKTNFFNYAECDEHLDKLLVQAKEWMRLKSQERQHLLELLYACSLSYQRINSTRQSKITEIIEVLSSQQMGSNAALFYKATLIPNLAAVLAKLKNTGTEEQDLEMNSSLELHIQKIPLIAGEPSFVRKVQEDTLQKIFDIVFTGNSESELFHTINAMSDEQVVPKKMLIQFRIHQYNAAFYKELMFSIVESTTATEQSYDNNLLPRAKQRLRETKELLSNNKAVVYDSMYDENRIIFCGVSSFLSLMASTGVTSCFGIRIPYIIALGSCASGTAVMLSSATADHFFTRNENTVKWLNPASFAVGTILGLILSYPTMFSMDCLRYMAYGLPAAQPLAGISLETMMSAKIPLLDVGTVSILSQSVMLLSLGSFIYGCIIEGVKSRGMI